MNVISILLFVFIFVYSIKRLSDYFEQYKKDFDCPDCLNDWDDIEYEDKVKDEEDI